MLSLMHTDRSQLSSLHKGDTTTLRGWMRRRGHSEIAIAAREMRAMRSREFFCASCNAMTVGGLCRVADSDLIAAD